MTTSHDARAFNGYTPRIMDGIVAGYWYWRYGDTRDDYGRLCVEVVHTVLGEKIVKCTHGDGGRGGRIANALNRLYGSIDAPVFDENNGSIMRHGH
jgi:hypothetical protein